jgi:hypothetical protein
MKSWKRAKLGVFVLCTEVVFLVLFGVFVRYDHLGMPTVPSTSESDIHTNGSDHSSSSSSSSDHSSGVVSHITQYYASERRFKCLL